MDNKQIITLNTENAAPVEFELLDIIQLEIDDENREFIVVAQPESDEVTILEMKDEDSVFIGVDAERTLLMVWEEFKKRNSDRFVFGGVDD